MGAFYTNKNNLPKKYSHFKLNIMPILSVVLLFLYLLLSFCFVLNFIRILYKINGFMFIVIWMTICSQRYQVNWENRQIYKNCMYFVIVFIAKHLLFIHALSILFLSLYSCPVKMCRFLSGNRINTILNDDLPKNLITLELRGNPLGDIKFDALQNMPRLRKLYVYKISKHVSYGVYGISTIPSITNSIPSIPN